MIDATIVGEMKPYRAGLLILFFAFLVGACGSAEGPPQTSNSTTDQPAITGEPAGFNADDVAFANDMLASYRQSAEIAALVPERSTNEDLIALADDVTSGQAPQLEMMKVFLVQWNENPNSNTGQGGIGGVGKGAIDGATMARLEASSGTEFDTLWLQSMAGHLQGAVDMAEAEITQGTNVDAVATARQIAGAERARVGRLQQMLGAG
jgi:uncharacterized protein (DUF305 family)